MALLRLSLLIIMKNRHLVPSFAIVKTLLFLVSLHWQIFLVAMIIEIFVLFPISKTASNISQICGIFTVAFGKLYFRE